MTCWQSLVLGNQFCWYLSLLYILFCEKENSLILRQIISLDYKNNAIFPNNFDGCTSVGFYFFHDESNEADDDGLDDDKFIIKEMNTRMMMVDG